MDGTTEDAADAGLFVGAPRHDLEEGRSARLIEGAQNGCFPSVWRAACASSSTVRTDNTPKVHFSATVGGELEAEVALV